MRAFVFTDPTLASQAGRFVWLELNTEKADNAPVTKRLAVSALPSFFVLDPADERVALRWVGGATTPHLIHILDDARLAVASGASGGVRHETTPADLALARADSLYGRADYAGAATAYDAAIAAAADGWPRYGRVVESLLYCLDQTGGYLRGAELALAAYPRLARSPSAASVASSGLDCAVSLKEDDPRRTELLAKLEPIARAVADDRTLAMAADDRSGVYISLLDARDAAKDSVGHHAVAEAWSGFLDGEAARARTPIARAVFDPHRLSAYIELGHAERAIPMLEASERDFPDDYNPPARLANAYRALKRWDEALAASDRAMQRAYGPRKLLLYANRTDIFLGRADSTSARRTVQEAIAHAKSLPAGQTSERTIANLEKRLAALGGAPPPTGAR
ncbi:MAG: thiol reductase thioredoxin [Candidatus Eisenbacteria bacterium]|uniref:Thiol reductase thioredoxin n=1 Tax=Eiseniibacteriota bacterium TaxID=2212470 RepID=A0A9D6L465_UNCEI|nr:thiol reductase thioredoxin [Candidatus Eisenbacteria bacterium]MBI3539487.1 thiol reductase thioredoxin [Candidatus Eisenbacteria bacterium]